MLAAMHSCCTDPRGVGDECAIGAVAFAEVTGHLNAVAFTAALDQAAGRGGTDRSSISSVASVLSRGHEPRGAAVREAMVPVRASSDFRQIMDGMSAVLIPCASRPPTSASSSAVDLHSERSWFLPGSAPTRHHRTPATVTCAPGLVRQCPSTAACTTVPAPLRSRHVERGQRPALAAAGAVSTWPPPLPGLQGPDRRRCRPPGPRPQGAAPDETRSIPIPPNLVQLLRNHLERYGTAPDGRIFFTTAAGSSKTAPTAPSGMRPAQPRSSPPSKPPRSPGGPATCGRVAGTEGRRARHRSRPPRRAQRRLAAFSPAAHEWGPPASRP